MSGLRISAEIFRSYVTRVPPALEATASEGAVARKVVSFLARRPRRALLPVMRTECGFG